MAGETVKAEAVCLRIVPWSRTSHIVQWLTPAGKVTTVVKGAVRPKSFFLGQYDLNYTCEIVYYARGKGELHALRECTPLVFREGLRGDYRALALAGYFRASVSDHAPQGPEAADWRRLLEASLDALAGRGAAEDATAFFVGELLEFERNVLKLAGLLPEIELGGGTAALRGERTIPVPAAVARCLENPRGEKKTEILLDAARVFGVFYAFHLDSAVDARRSVLKVIS